MKINYLDLLIKLSNGETPDLIKLELNCGERYYQAFYDGGEFNYYGLCDAHLEDEDFKYYLSDTLLESQMFEDNIEIIEEDKEIEELKQYYDEDLDEYVVETYINGINYKEIYKSRYDEMMIKKISELIDEVNKLKS